MSNEYDWKEIARERQQAIQRTADEIASQQAQQRAELQRAQEADCAKISAFKDAIKTMQGVALRIQEDLAAGTGKPSLIAVTHNEIPDALRIRINPDCVPYAGTWKQLPIVEIRTGDPLVDGMLFVSKRNSKGIAEPMEPYRGKYGPPLTFEMHGEASLDDIVSRACNWLVQQANEK
jgi:hypothetical protein